MRVKLPGFQQVTRHHTAIITRFTIARCS